MIFVATALFFSTPIIPPLMDAWIPLNESRSRIYIYEIEYFIDQEKYYYLILFHAYLTAPVAFLCIVFFDNLFSVFINHTRGMGNVLK